MGVKVSGLIINGAFAMAPGTNNFDIEHQNLFNQFNIAVKQFEVQKLIVKELEEVAIPNSVTIFETAQKQFLNGDINYLEWAMLVNQSISIKSDYQDAILRLNKYFVYNGTLIRKVVPMST